LCHVYYVGFGIRPYAESFYRLPLNSYFSHGMLLVYPFSDGKLCSLPTERGFLERWI